MLNDVQIHVLMQLRMPQLLSATIINHSSRSQKKK